jgi:hypothetical protein
MGILNAQKILVILFLLIGINFVRLPKLKFFDSDNQGFISNFANKTVGIPAGTHRKSNFFCSNTEASLWNYLKVKNIKRVSTKIFDDYSVLKNVLKKYRRMCLYAPDYNMCLYMKKDEKFSEIYLVNYKMNPDEPFNGREAVFVSTAVFEELPR